MISIRRPTPGPTLGRSLRAALVVIGGALLVAACAADRSPLAGTCFGSECEFGPAAHAVAASQ